MHKIPSVVPVVVISTSAGSSLQYPVDAPTLVPGQTYLWKVSGSSLEELPEVVRITIRSPSPQDTLPAQLRQASDDPLATAQLYICSRLWYDTVAALSAGASIPPTRTDPREQLKVLYKAIASGCSTVPAR